MYCFVNVRFTGALATVTTTTKKKNKKTMLLLLMMMMIIIIIIIKYANKSNIQNLCVCVCVCVCHVVLETAHKCN